MSIRRGQKTPGQHWHAPSSLSKTSGTLPHHVCKSLWQRLFPPIIHRIRKADELGGGGSREVIHKFKPFGDEITN